MTRPGSLFAVPDSVAQPAGRVLTCTECRTPVEVFEIPTPRLSPDAYVCGQCLTDPEPTPTPKQAA